jgi:Tol biopolymer transport system component
MRSRLAVVLASTLVYALVLAAVPAHAAFPGNNGKIAFARAMVYQAAEIFTMNPDGSAQTNITNDPAHDVEPAWSADGTKIAFASYRTGNGDIYTMNADGTGLLRVTSDPATEHDPAWSPDGTRIVFTSEATSKLGATALVVVNSDGSGGIKGLPGYGVNINANWSPDGSLIAFAAGGFKPFDIATIDPAGTALIDLTHSPSYDNYGPNWSPDGARIAFESGRDEFAEIHTMNADGSGVIRINTDPAWDRYPAWSPDGQKIVFQTTRDDPNLNCFACIFQIYVMNSDGSSPARLTNSPTVDSSPDWQPVSAPPPGPQPGDYKNARRFCKAERDFLGKAAFRQKYGENAFRQCVRRNGPKGARRSG